MDSINQQQPEDNFENLAGSEAALKSKALIEKAEICFFCTKLSNGQAFSTRPMSVLKVDDDSTCWFLSSIDSHKNLHIAEDSAIQLLFQGSTYSDFLSMYGHASINQNKEKIKELWNPIIKTWFTEGIDDPRITVIKFSPVEGYYWDTKHGQIVAFAKRLVGAAIGKTLDDSIEGTLKM